MASEIRVNRLSNRSGLSTITFANGGVQFSGITTFANGDFRVGTGATILNPSANEMQFHTGGSNRLTINNSGANLGTGNITAVDATFSGNVSICKTLTYEDVTNIDSVGIVTAREGVFIPDSKKLQLGNAAGSADLEVFHDGSNSYIKDVGTGDLNIAGSIVRLQSSAGETLCRGVEDGAFELYHDNSKKIETTDTGAIVTGVCTATSFSGRHAEVPKNAQTGAYTLVKSDSGKCVSTNSGVTVPNAVFAAGDCVTIWNDSSSAITITQGSGFQLREAGETSTGNVSLKNFGLATIWWNTGGTAVISGNLA